MSRRRIFGITIILVALVGVCPVFGLGMRVQPGGALIQGWPVGERRELPVPLVIFNDDDQPHKVTVSACKPSAIGGAAVRGYREIPDPAWLTFAPDEARVPPRGRAKLKMFLSVPADEKYRNAHWSVNLAVRSSTSGRQKIGLALYPRFEIETAAGEARVAPHGDLVVTPSLVAFDDVVPGKKAEEASVTVWNNTKKVQHCKARILGKPATGRKPIILLSHGRSWVPAASWVSVRTPTFSIPAAGKVQVRIRPTLPAAASHGGVWEAILLVTAKEGPETFARIRVATSKKR